MCFFCFILSDCSRQFTQQKKLVFVPLASGTLNQDPLHDYDVLFIRGLAAPLALLMLFVAAGKGVSGALCRMRPIQRAGSWAPAFLLFGPLGHIDKVVARHSGHFDVNPTVWFCVSMLLALAFGAFYIETLQTPLTAVMEKRLRVRRSRYTLLDDDDDDDDDNDDSDVAAQSRQRRRGEIEPLL